jgi:hypothetical protein
MTVNLRLGLAAPIRGGRDRATGATDQRLEQEIKFCHTGVGEFDATR